MSDIETRELLSAYACGDVSPEQRVAVERLLASGGDAETELRELKALLPSLAQAERPVSGVLMGALRKRIEALHAKQSREPVAAVLLSASLTGDVDASEKALVNQYLLDHPAAQIEQRSLREFTGLLKQGELPVSAALMARFTERLAGALPVSRPVSVPQKRITQVLKVQARESEPTVRVLASTRTYVWRPRLVWTGAAVAALLAVAFGLWRLLESRATDSTAIANQNKNEAPAPVVPQVVKDMPKVQDPGIAPVPEVVQQRTPEADRPPVAHDQTPVPLPRDAVQNIAPPPQDVVKREPRPTLGTKEPYVAQTPTLQPRDRTPPKNGIAPREQPPVVNQQTPQTPTPHSSGGGGGGSLVIPANPAVVNATDTPANQTPTTDVPANSAVVLRQADGNVQAQWPGAAAKVLADNDVVPSGATITTAQGRVGLTVPGGAKLFVNSDSSLTVRFSGSETTVTLVRGEVAYRSSGAGTLSLLASTGNNASVTKAKYADIRIAGSTMETNVLNGSAKVSVNGKDTTIPKDNKATVALAGNEAPRKETITGRPPDTWSYDLDRTTVNTSDGRGGRSRTSRR